MFTVSWLQGDKLLHRETMLHTDIADVVRTARDMLGRVRRRSGGETDTIMITDATGQTLTMPATVSSMWMLHVTLCAIVGIVSMVSFIYFSRFGWPEWMVPPQTKKHPAFLLAVVPPVCFMCAMAAYIFRNRWTQPAPPERGPAPDGGIGRSIGKS